MWAQFHVLMRCTNMKLRSAGVVHLNHDFEPWLYVLDADWTDLVEIIDVTHTVYKRKQESLANAR